MLWRIVLTGLAIWLALCVPFYPAPARADLALGQRFADLKFSGALSVEDRAYLGLVGQPGEFALADIKARYVLLEIFSDACPHCMLQAPVVNRLFRLVAQDPKLRGALKMMGVGFYCTAAAMAKWQVKYRVPFPLIPDPRAQVARTLDIPGTPTYVVLDREGRVVYVFAGDIDNPGKFLKEVRAHLKF